MTTWLRNNCNTYIDQEAKTIRYETWLANRI